MRTALIAVMMAAQGVGSAWTFDGKTYSPNTVDVAPTKHQPMPNFIIIWYMTATSDNDTKIYYPPNEAAFIYASKPSCETATPTDTDTTIYACESLLMPKPTVD